MHRAIDVIASRRWSDMTRVARVVHDVYVETGFSPPRPSRMRVIPSYFNEDAVFLLARWRGEDVAAAVMVRDGAFGLPSDRAFREEMDGLRGTATAVYELTSLSVRRSHRRHYRHLLPALIGPAVRLLRAAGPEATCVISVPPDCENRYRALMGFTRAAEDERGLYGPPALFLSARASTIDATLPHTHSGAQILQASGDGPHPWLDWDLAPEAWPAHSVLALSQEQRSLGMLEAQLTRLANGHPEVFSRLLNRVQTGVTREQRLVTF